jgi:hypothetical protein
MKVTSYKQVKNYFFIKKDTLELSLKQRLALDDRIVRLLEKKVRLFLKALPNETLESA